MNNKSRTNIVLFICVSILVIGTFFTVFLYNPEHYKISSNEGKCYVALPNTLIFKEGIEKFPIIKEIDCSLLNKLKEEYN
jgi:hypothetical protein